LKIKRKGGHSGTGTTTYPRKKKIKKNTTNEDIKFNITNSIISYEYEAKINWGEGVYNEKIKGQKNKRHRTNKREGSIIPI
jgi:hypothetical protein